MPQGKLKIVASSERTTVTSNVKAAAIEAANEGTVDATDEATLKTVFTGLTEQSKTLMSHLVSRFGTKKSFLITCLELHHITKLHDGSIQRILTNFDKEKFLTKRRFRDGKTQGLEIRLNPVCNYFHKFNPAEATGVPTPDPQFSHSIERSNYNSSYSEEALKILNVTEEAIATQYPFLADIGFGTDQLKQIVDHREGLGLSSSSVLRSLGHAEYLLERGPIIDGFGRVVEKPLGYLFKKIFKDGWLDKPSGFKTVEELEAEELEKELRIVEAAKKKKRDHLYSLWLLDVSDAEKEEILNKKQFGPDDSFLKTYWMKNVWSKQGGGNG